MGPPKAKKDLNTPLTEQEGRALALIARLAKPTAHEVFAIFAGSPTRSLHASKGTIYPIVARLKQRGLICATPSHDGRRSEWLEVTPAGREAVIKWLQGIDGEHTLPYDPIRTRIPSLEMLSHEQRLAWIAKARRLNGEMRREVDRYRDTVELSYADASHRSAIEHLDAQLRWLDHLQITVLQGERDIRPTKRKDDD